MRPNKKPNVKISFSFPYDKPDANGDIYTKEAAYKAVQNIKDLPIIFNDFRNKDCSNPEDIIIGVTRKFKVEDDKDNSEFIVTIESYLFSNVHCGTCETVELTDKHITNAEIQSVNICIE